MEQDLQYPHAIKPTEVLTTHRHPIIIFILSLIFVTGIISWGMLLFGENSFQQVPVQNSDLNK